MTTHKYKFPSGSIRTGKTCKEQNEGIKDFCEEFVLCYNCVFYRLGEQGITEKEMSILLKRVWNECK